jgi:hypothetical protein
MGRQVEAASRKRILSLAFGVSSFAASAAGPSDVQRLFLRDLFFQAKAVEGKEPCYVWGQAPVAGDSSIVRSDASGPYVQVTVPYRRINAECKFVPNPGGADLKDFPGEDGAGSIVARARPPLSVVPVANGGLQEELLFETRIEELKDLNVLSFFGQTLIQGEASWFWLASNDSALNKPWVSTWPVLKASLEFPFPLWRRLETALSLTQSMGRAGVHGLKMSAFNLRLSVPIIGRVFAEPYSWSVGACYQGSNFFQTEFENPDFRLSSLRSIGGWSRATWSPELQGGERAFALRRFGVAVEGAYSVSGSGGQRVSELSWEAALSLRGGLKWGLLTGYESRQQTSARKNDDGSALQESSGKVFLRLQLMPYLGNKETP